MKIRCKLVKTRESASDLIFVILSMAKNPVWQRWNGEILRFAQDEYKIYSMQDNAAGFACALRGGETQH